MRRAISAGLLLLVVATAFPATEEDVGTRLHSRPLLPDRAALARLNLKMAWHGFIPMDGRRDAFTSIQLHDRHLIAQTRSGLVTMLESDTGRTVWRTRAGQAYLSTVPLAYNYRSVFVVNGTVLYALDRETGAEQWNFDLPAGLSAGPVADDEFIYFSTVTTRLYAYRLPLKPVEEVLHRGAVVTPPPASTAADGRPILPHDKNRGTTGSLTYLSGARGSGREIVTGPQPTLRWDTMTNVRLELQPVLSRTTMLVASPVGTIFGMVRDPINRSNAVQAYRFDIDGTITADPAHFDEIAYIGSRDANLYAIDVATGQTVWRYSFGTPIVREPIATEEDLFVTGDRAGLARVDRLSGTARWNLAAAGRTLPANPEADRFVAANPKFVYARDRLGRLLVLDRARGVTLSRYDVRDFPYPVANAVTDRIFLVANNGLIVCLHDLEFAQPVRHRKREEATQNPVLAVREALETPITQKGGDLRPLREVLRDLGHRLNISIVIAERAFKEAKAKPISDELVRAPAADNTPLKDFLKQMLDPLGATFQSVGGTIFILPSEQQPAAPMDKK